jgi:hypothetical protein
VRGCAQTSRFWGGGSGSDDSASDASSSSSDSDSEEELVTGPSKYLRDDSSSDDESDDGRRVVRSAKDKRYLELEETCKDMLNKQKINDWCACKPPVALSGHSGVFGRSVLYGIAPFRDWTVGQLDSRPARSETPPFAHRLAERATIARGDWCACTRMASGR